ncbi:MAG: response regulator [Anaerolineae bacterium]
MSQLPILVIEDDPDGQFVIARMLKQVQLDVVLAASAEEGWELLQERSFAGAIIDLALPGKDGFQMLALIRSHPKLRRLKCVAVTAYHTPMLKHNALEVGFDAYFAKPVNRTLFLGAMEELIFQNEY